MGVPRVRLLGSRPERMETVSVSERGVVMRDWPGRRRSSCGFVLFLCVRVGGLEKGVGERVTLISYFFSHLLLHLILRNTQPRRAPINHNSHASSVTLPEGGDTKAFPECVAVAV